MRWLRICLSSLAVLAACGVPFLLWWGPRGSAPAAAADGGPRAVEAERHYYVLLTVVEAEPQKEGGKRWDADGSAPDLYYEVWWQGQEVFESSTKKDTLVARWTNVAVDLSDVANGVSLDDSIKAARIAARPGDRIGFRVHDEDLAAHDLVGRFEVAVEDLHEGDQTWTAPAGRLKSVTCRVLPLDGVDFSTLTR